MRLKVVALSLVAMLMCCSGAWAQQNTGDISGTVKDPSGAVVAGAKVTVLDSDKNIEVRSLTTNATGDFSFPSLPVGHYSLGVEATNFQKYTQTGITLNVSDKLVLFPTLQVGSSSEQVTVEAAAAQVNLQSPVAAGVVTGTQVRELVVNNRAFQSLIALVPGVTDSNNNDVYQVGATNGAGGFNSFGFQINGARREENNFLVDGMDNVDRGSNLTLLSWPSLDAISEFRVVRGVYDPDTGRSAGAQINVITRSGTSSLHGGVYEFLRNDYLNANSPFNKASQRAACAANPALTCNKAPALRYNDFGGTVGGPVYIPHLYEHKDKTFFFVSEEARRIITYTVPTPASLPYSSMLSGNFNDVVCTSWAITNGTNGNCAVYGKSVTNISPVASAYVKDFFSKLPTPNLVTASNPFQFVTTLRNVFDFREDLVRIDHTLTNKIQLNGKYQQDHIPTREAGGLGASYGVDNVATTLTNSPGKQYRIGATITLSPTFLIEPAWGYSYGAILTTQQGLVSTGASPDVLSALGSSIPFTDTVGRIPILNISGGNGVPGVTTPYRDINKNQTGLTNVTKVIGNHTVKFGGVYYHYNKHENLLSNNNTGTFSTLGTNLPSCVVTKGVITTCTQPNGSQGPVATAVCNGPAGGGTSLPCGFTYEQSFANFLQGNLSGFSQASFDNTANVFDNQFEYFAQDAWRVKSNLTFTFGFRHSFFRQPTDASGPGGKSLLSNFDPALWNPAQAPCILPNGNLDVKFVNGLPVSSACNPNYNPLNGFIFVNPPGTNGLPTFNGFVGTQSPYGDKVGKEFNRAIAPRVGIAWDPFSDGRTSIRAGYGMFYDNGLEFGQSEINVGLDPGFIQNLSFSNVTFASPTASTTNTVQGTLASSAAPSTISARSPINYKSPYTQQWSLDIQRQLKGNWMVDVGYYGNNGVHLPGYVDSNGPLPDAYLKCAYPNKCTSGPNTIQITATGAEAGAANANAAGGSACNGIPCITSSNTGALNVIRPYIGYASWSDFEEMYTSNYNSFQAQVQKRFRGSSLVNLAYTWSHGLTTYQADRSTGGIMPNSYTAVFPNNYGPDIADRRHVLTANFVYEVPFMHDQRGIVGHVLGGWELTGIQTFQTGLPITPTISGAGVVDTSGTGCLAGAAQCGARLDQVGDPNSAPASCPLAAVNPCYHTWNGWYNPTAFVAYGTCALCTPYTGQTNIPTARPGAARLPGLVRTDLGAFKNIRFSERFTGQLRLEMFNAFNQTNPICCTSNAVTSGSYAKPSGTLTPRNLQLGMKINF